MSCKPSSQYQYQYYETRYSSLEAIVQLEFANTLLITLMKSNSFTQYDCDSYLFSFFLKESHAPPKYANQQYGELESRDESEREFAAQ